MSTPIKLEWEHVLLIIIVAGSLVARSYEVNYNLDGGEIFSVKLASKSFAEVISQSMQDRPHPPLHNVLLYLWIKTFGDSETSVRAMSIMFSGFFMLMSYMLVRRLMSAWLSLGLATILSVSPFFILYGQQARPYALIAFLSAANLLAFVKVLNKPRERKVVAIWSISCAFLVYAQYMGILLIFFEISIVLLFLRSRRLAVLFFGIGGCALILPWLIVAMGPAISMGIDPLPHISWIEPPTLSSFMWFYVGIFGESPWLQVRWLFLLLAFPAVAYLRHLVALRRIPAIHVLLFLCGIGMPTIVYILSVWGPKPLFAPRQMIGAAIAFVASIGLCFSALPRTLAIGILIALLIWTTSTLPHAFPHITMPPWRDMAANIDKQYGRIVVVTQEDWIKEPLDYYRKLGPVRLWGELSKLEENDQFLFVCRPTKNRCSKIENEALRAHRSLLEIRRWGNKTSEFNQLRLYKINDSTELNTNYKTTNVIPE